MRRASTHTPGKDAARGEALEGEPRGSGRRVSLHLGLTVELQEGRLQQQGPNREK